VREGDTLRGGAAARGHAGGKPRCVRLKDGLKARVQDPLRAGWSPERIGGRLRVEGGERMSHETIHRHVWRDKARGGTLHLPLRHAPKKRRRRRGVKERRGRIPHRVDISERPAVVGERSRFGDWEADTVIGKGGAAGFIGKAYDPYRLYQDPARQLQLDDLELRKEVPSDRLQSRFELLRGFNGSMPALERAVSGYARDQYYQKAFDLVTSGKARHTITLIA